MSPNVTRHLYNRQLSSFAHTPISTGSSFFLTTKAIKRLASQPYSTLHHFTRAEHSNLRRPLVATNLLDALNMFRTTPVLALPLKAIRWFAEEIYKKNPEARLEAERAIKVFYDENKDNLERRGVTEALVKLLGFGLRHMP